MNIFSIAQILAKSWNDAMFVESIQCGYYQSKPSRNLCDPKLHIFAPNFFNFEIIFALRIFETFVASNVFTFTFC